MKLLKNFTRHLLMALMKKTFSIPEKVSEN